MRLLLGGGLALAVLAAACSDNAVAPKSLANPQATTAELAALDTIFGSSTLKSFSAVAGTITPASAPVPAMALAVNPLMQSSALRPYASRIEGARIFSRLVPQLSVVSAAAIFPDTLQGTTFEWDFTTNAYVKGTRTGAPAHGVRFILYAIDELTGYPAGPAPGTEVGYLDLDDVSSGSPSLHVTVAGVGGTPKYVDYTVTLTNQSATSVRLSTSGYITNGDASPDSLRFSGAVSASGSASSVQVTEDVSFDVNSRDIHVRNWQQITLTQTSVGLRISFRFEHGGEVVTIDGTLNVDQSAGTVTGTITSRVDGGLFATCSVAGTSTTYSLTCQGADADGLNADEQAALDKLGNSVQTIGNLFEGLLNPAVSALGA